MNVDKNWDINVLFIIHVYFDHAWAEHHPVTVRMAAASSSTVLESTASDESGDGNKTLSLGPQVAQQIPFQVRTSFTCMPCH